MDRKTDPWDINTGHPESPFVLSFIAYRPAIPSYPTARSKTQDTPKVGPRYLALDHTSAHDADLGGVRTAVCDPKR